ncbi:MAG: glycosyltransferase family 9 protein [Chloroflexales bacterium]|nr:glycosyltransferase family 9 protein [Chloroflexales bacterium]
MQISSEWLAARRVLAVRLDNLGDVLVTTPAIRAIKESLPGAEVTLLASPVGAQVGRLNHTIDDVLVYEAPWMDPWAHLPLDSEREQRFIAELRARRFDAAVIFTSFRQSSLPSAYLCYLADIPLRHAASLDGPGSLLTTRHKHPERLMHEVERGLDLVGAIGMGTSDTRLLLEVPEQARTALALRFPTVGDRGRRIAGNALHQPSMDNPLVVLHPGCSMPARTYPWQQFADAADLLIERLGATVVITGSEGERELVERIRGRMRRPSIGLAGALPFALFCALVEAADLVVTNNTGPMHMAAALQTPVVALFALTNPPEQWRPWRVPHRQLFHDVPCRICYSRLCPVGHECLRLVSPEMVVDAAAALLSAEERGLSTEFPARAPLNTQRSALSTGVERTDA